jgi:hypothetical protein
VETDRLSVDDRTMRHTARHRGHRSIEGDVHVGTMSADVPLVPGSTTPTGAAAIEREARRVLARVRRGIERRRWHRGRR